MVDNPIQSINEAQKLSVLFQAAKLGDLEALLEEIAWAQVLIRDQVSVDRIYGLSGGGLTAFAFALVLAAGLQPEHFSSSSTALKDLSAFLRNAQSHHLRRFNLNPWYGLNNLDPLRTWLEHLLIGYHLDPRMKISSLPMTLYLCAGDQDGTLTLFGPPDDALQFEYTWVRVGPPQDAPLVDALIAGLSTALSTEPGLVNNTFYRDCRPAIADGSAIIVDIEAHSPRPILRRQPYTPAPPWRSNWITSSFIMHRKHESNQAILAHYYTDLLERHRALLAAVQQDESGRDPSWENARDTPRVSHIDLPYIGSTEAITNMRQSVAEKDTLMRQFNALLEGQFDGVDFSRPMNVIYGAGGFSGILAGLVTTRQVQLGFTKYQGKIKQIYGVSAGVLNGFFHAIEVAAQQHPSLYTPAAHHALTDLERFFENIGPRRIASLNLNPKRFWRGWAHLGPLKAFLRDRLVAYTDIEDLEALTFDDIQLPLTVAVARDDGLTDFLGMTSPLRCMRFAGNEIKVLPAPILQALIAGWSMNTYIQPMIIDDQTYRDGGGSFYDPALFVACLDSRLENLLNIHLDEPEGHSYNLPPRPSLLRLIFDTHNYNFPEERRRMRLLTDLLYAHYALRQHAAQTAIPPSPDFRQEWDPPTRQKILA